MSSIREAIHGTNTDEINNARNMISYVSFYILE